MFKYLEDDDGTTPIVCTKEAVQSANQVSVLILVCALINESINHTESNDVVTLHFFIRRFVKKQKNV